MPDERVSVQRRLGGEYHFSFTGENGGSVKGEVTIDEARDLASGARKEGASPVYGKIRALVAELNYILNRESNASRS